MAELQEQDFAALINEMRGGQTIVIMGPEAHLLDKYNEDELPNHFEIILQQSPELRASRGFDLKDGFFSCNSSSSDKYPVLQTLNNYYGSLTAPAFYKWIAALPFSMIISLSPDTLMEQVMDEMGFDFDFAFYKKSSAGLYMRRRSTGDPLSDFEPIPDLEQLPTPNKPLLFNMLGYYAYTDSLLFTYEAFFEFLYSNFPVDRIPARLRSAICNGTSFLFVGFGYHQWYLKIIFFMLEKIIISGTRRLAGKAIFNYGDAFSDTIGVYERVFPIRFYQQSTKSFAQKLFDDLRAKGFMKSPKPGGAFRTLFIASLPDGMMPLRQDKEWKDIKKELGVAEALGKIVLSEVFCATINEMLVAISKYNPDLLVLSMHGNPNGLFFEDGNGDQRMVDVPLFIQNLETSRINPGYRLKGVLLGACHSAAVAEEVHKHVDYAIGFAGAVQDEVVRIFTRAFFETLPNQFSIDASVQSARQIILNDSTYSSSVSQLKYFGKEARSASARLPAGAGARV